jgi:hypothetical protein
MQDKISFEKFRDQWLQDIRSSTALPIGQERRFAEKLFAQWRNLSGPSDDLILVEPHDVGIDLAYFERGESSGDAIAGDTWYVVSAKCDTTINGEAVLGDGLRLIDMLTSQHESSTFSEYNLIARLHQFLAEAHANDRVDRLVFVVATELPADSHLKKNIERLRVAGRERLGSIFDVTAISIETIYLNTLDDTTAADEVGVRLTLKANVKASAPHLMIGSVALPDLYEFLKTYRDKTEDLDQLYEKNVRQYLGGRRRVNKGIQNTLLHDPEQFGLYNNGITIVVSNFVEQGNGIYELVQPYIVNGCQTTRTIWDVFRQQLESNRKKHPNEVAQWESRVAKGVVVTKIVRVGSSNEDLLDNITKYTNSQNAVSEKDFVTLDEGFRGWKREMADKYEVFLEIQRGGWDSYQALQKQNPGVQQFSHYANGFDLLKVYGSGWLREAGTAFGRNAAFVPGGTLFRQIVERDGEPFGVDDLFAAYCLQGAADQFGFGRGSKKTSRRQTRYLFYLVTTDLLRDVMIRANMSTTQYDLTQAFIRVFGTRQQEAAKALLDVAVGVIDEYLTQGEEESVFTEPAFKARFNLDLNGFLKWEALAKSDNTPAFNSVMAINKRTMGRGQPSPRELITSAIV